jgi:hypothetical protein
LGFELMAKSRRCHVLPWPDVDEADDDGMTGNRGRRINAVVVANSGFLVGSIGNPGDRA